MHILILGAAGMLGRKLISGIARTGRVAGEKVDRLTLVDVADFSIGPLHGIEVDCLRAGLEDSRLVWLKPDLIFHLAAVVSGQAETAFDLGYAVNLRAPWTLLDAFAAQGNAPRSVFASSLAVYGAPFPELVPEDFAARPQSSYGTQKLIFETLLADYTRKGLLRGISLRLPTVTIRPGVANAAASSFLSAILREPLDGQPAILPVPRNTRVWIAPPSVAVRGLLHAATLAGLPETHVAINLPGTATDVAAMLDALEAQAGRAALDLITEVPDRRIQDIVASWPGAFATERATALGFGKSVGLGEIIGEYLAGR